MKNIDCIKNNQYWDKNCDFYDIKLRKISTIVARL